MLQTTVALYRHYLPADPRSEDFARLIESLDEGRWQHLVDHMPAAIAEGEPARFGSETHGTATELAERAET